MEAVPPHQVLVVLLGASEWPKAPEFEASHAFTNSALAIRDYFVDKKRFGLPEENLLNLFDSDLSYDEIDEMVGEWIESRLSEPEGKNVSDLIVVFVGHAGFEHGHDEYFLAIRRSRQTNFGASSIPISVLARTIKERARRLRRYVVLDCCYAASAFKHFQSSNIAEVATRQALEAFAVAGKGYGVPTKGTSLLCSSRHNKPSLLSPTKEFTIFTEALLHALNSGNPQYQDLLPLEMVCQLSKDYLKERYEEAAPRPEVHSPDQSEGVVAQVPLFPNLARIGATSATPESPRADDSATGTTEPSDESNITKPSGAREIEELRSLVSEKGSNPHLHAELGDALLASNRWNEAATSFEKAIKLDRNVASWHYSLAIAIVESNGSADKAEEEFLTAVNLEPENHRFRLDYAYFLSRRRKWSSVIPQLVLVLAKDPENVEVQTQLKLAEQQNELAKENYLRGSEFENLGRFDEALECYRNVHSIEIDFSDVNSKIATLLAQEDRRKKIDKIRGSLASEPDNPELHVALGRLYFDGRFLEQAETALQRAIELDGRNAESHALLGRIYHSREEWQAAEREFAEALALDPQSVERHIELGSTAFAQMEWDKALAIYEAAKTFATEFKTEILLRQLIVNAKEKKRHEERRRVHRDAQEFTSAGKQFFSEERWGEAEAALEKARQIDPTNPKRYLHLGAIAFAQLDWNKAIQHYNKGLQLTSDPILEVVLKKAKSRAKELKRLQYESKTQLRWMLIASGVFLILVVMLILTYFKH